MGIGIEALFDIEAPVVSGGDFCPPADDTFDLGSSTRAWKDGHFDGVIYTDDILEHGSGQGVTIEGVLLKDSDILIPTSNYLYLRNTNNYLYADGADQLHIVAGSMIKLTPGTYVQCEGDFKTKGDIYLNDWTTNDKIYLDGTSNYIYADTAGQVNIAAVAMIKLTPGTYVQVESDFYTKGDIHLNVWTTNDKIYLYGANNYIYGDTAGQVNIVAAAMIKLTPTTYIKCEGALHVGHSAVGHDVTLYADTANYRVLFDAEGDGNKGSFEFGQNLYGIDAKFFGRTTGNYMLWDASADDLLLVGTATQLAIAGDTDASTSTDGSLRTAGGCGIAKKLFVGTNLDVAGTSALDGAVTCGGDVTIAATYGIVIGSTTVQLTTTGFFCEPQLQVLGTDNDTSSLTIARFSNDNSQPGLRFVKSKGTTITDGTAGAVASGALLGTVVWYADDGTDLKTAAAQIEVTVTDTVAENQIPTKMVFSTTTTGGTRTTALTIDDDQSATFAGAVVATKSTGTGVNVNGIFGTLTVTGDCSGSVCGLRVMATHDGSSGRTTGNFYGANISARYVHASDRASGIFAALQVAADMGEATGGSMWAYGINIDLSVAGGFSRATEPKAFIDFQDYDSGGTYRCSTLFDIGGSGSRCSTGTSGDLHYNDTLKIIVNTTNKYIPLSTVEGTYTTASLIQSSLATDAGSTTTGAVIIAGGVGIAKKLYTGDTTSLCGAKAVFNSWGAVFGDAYYLYMRSDYSCYAASLAAGYLDLGANTCIQLRVGATGVVFAIKAAELDILVPITASAGIILDAQAKITLGITDTNSTTEGDIWYGATHNTIRVCTASDSVDSVVLRTATETLQNKSFDTDVTLVDVAIINLKAGTSAINPESAHRGQFYFTEGVGGVADKLYCIMKGAGDTYSAIQVAIG